MESENESDGWEEVIDDGGIDSEVYTCLMCPTNFASCHDFLGHLALEHGWKVNFQIKRKLLTDQYDWIRFVNYVRKLVSFSFTTPNLLCLMPSISGKVCAQQQVAIHILLLIDHNYTLM